MPTPEELQKRLERMVKLATILRTTQIGHGVFNAAHTFELMNNATKEFDKALAEENKIRMSKQPDLPF